MEAGWAGYGGKFGYKDTSSAKEAKEFFQSGEGVKMISTAECVKYKLKLNTYVMPGTFLTVNVCEFSLNGY